MRLVFFLCFCFWPKRLIFAPSCETILLRIQPVVSYSGVREKANKNRSTAPVSPQVTCQVVWALNRCGTLPVYTFVDCNNIVHAHPLSTINRCARRPKSTVHEREGRTFAEHAGYCRRQTHNCTIIIIIIMYLPRRNILYAFVSSHWRCSNKHVYVLFYSVIILRYYYIRPCSN